MPPPAIASRLGDDVDCLGHEAAHLFESIAF
jgi:hypothetical protein